MKKKLSVNQRCPPFRVSVNWKEYCTNRSNAPTSVNLISTSSENENTLATTRSHTTIILTGKLVNSKVNLSNTIKSIQMLFETKEIELPEDLETVNTIVVVKLELNHRLRIPISNNFNPSVPGVH